MTDLTDRIWKRNEIDSPCTKICQLHPTEKICIGCLRTMEEISIWSRLTPETKAEIMADLPERAPRLRKRRRGRAARLRDRK